MERLQGFSKALLFGLALLCCSGLGRAGELVFAVTEGVTYQSTNRDIQQRFQPLANALAKALQRPVNLTVVPAYADLRDGLNFQRYDLAFVHPAHVALQAAKSGRYKTMAWTDGYSEYAVSILVRAEKPPLTRWADMKGKTLVTTDPDSITSVMVRAILKEQGLGNGEVHLTHTRYQDALPFYVDKGFAQGAATASSGVVKAWTSGGGRVMYTSRGLPIKTVLASNKLAPEDLDRVRGVLLANDRAVIEALGYKGFIAPDPQTEQRAIAWLGL